MEDKDVKGEDYFLVTFGSLCGLAMTITNAIVCHDTWQIIWIVIAVISVVCYIISWFLNFTVKDGFGLLLIYMLYSFFMFFAGCGTALFTWGGDNWILILTFPFAMLGLVAAPFAIIGIAFSSIVGVYGYFDEHKNPTPNKATYDTSK